MKIVGLTGGIGSGKTTVAKQFKTLGIPVYIADEEAKKLIDSSKIIKRELVELFGESAYINNQLNKVFIADIIFNDRSYLEKMNAIVHPRVATHFKTWQKKQKSAYVIKEVAILFENGGDKHCDYIITVTAPLELRMERLLARDATTKEKIQAIIKNQWSDSEKIKRSHYVITNITLENTMTQVNDIHHKIMNALA